MENNKEYIITKFLGKGKSGTIFLGIYGEELVAMKIIKLSKDEGKLKSLYNEINILKFLTEKCPEFIAVYKNSGYITNNNIAKKLINCDNIEKNIDIQISNDVKDYFVIIMEYIEGYVLYDKIGKYEENEILYIGVELFKCIKLIHDNKCCHRDIKPENIMIDKNNKIKLIDFGLSICIDKCQNNKIVGTPLYFSPEKVRNFVNDENYNIYIPKEDENIEYSSDIWAAGMTLYILTGSENPILFNSKLKFKSKKYLPQSFLKETNLYDRYFYWELFNLNENYNFPHTQYEKINCLISYLNNPNFHERKNIEFIINLINRLYEI